MENNIKRVLVISTLALASNVHAEEMWLYPGTLSSLAPQIDGISYEQAINIINQERVLEYGLPVEVEINHEEGTVDLSGFDDFVIRIPLEEALVQPNRIEPTR